MKDAEKLINWRELSRILAGGEKSINRKRIPKKHQQKVDELLEAVQNWKESVDKHQKLQ